MSITIEQLRDIANVPEPRISALRDFQLAATRHMIRWPRSINGLPTGKGKTITSIATCDAARLFPANIVCSKRVALQWAGEFHRWLNGNVSVSVLDGRKVRPFEGEHFYTLAGNETIQVPVNDLSADVVMAPYSVVYDWAEALMPRGARVLIMDELRIRSRKTMQSMACRYLASHVVQAPHFQHIYGLTADTIVNRPKDLRGILETLGVLQMFGGWEAFRWNYCGMERQMRVHGDGRVTGYTSDSGSSNELDLHNKLKYLGILFRMTEKECMPDAPEKVRITVPVRLSNQAEYDRAEADLIGYVRELARIRGNDAEHAAARALRSKALARVTVLRRLVGLGKVESMIGMRNDFHAENPGRKYISFAHHVECQEALSAAAPDCAQITGKQSTQETDANKLRFQTDPSCLDITVSTEAGGEGLNLAAAEHMGILEYPWTHKQINQMHGRCYMRMDNPHGITAFHFHAAGTIDDHMRKISDRKLQVASLIHDGVEGDDFLAPVTNDDLLEAYATHLG